MPQLRAAPGKDALLKRRHKEYMEATHDMSD